MFSKFLQNVFEYCLKWRLSSAGFPRNDCRPIIAIMQLLFEKAINRCVSHRDSSLKNVIEATLSHYAQKCV